VVNVNHRGSRSVMRVMRRLRCLLLALPLAVLTGCFASDSGDCLRPIDEFIPPDGPRADGTRGGAGGGGQCAPWVEVGGADYNWYRDLRAEGWRFHIDASELVPFDEATEANWLVHPVTDAAVWSVGGLDPGDFVAMRSAEDGEFFILVRDGAQLRADVASVLCRYATGLEHTVREQCGAAAPLDGREGASD
jgi:hypothetical protein